MRIKSLIHIILTIILLVSCGDNQKYVVSLNEADRIIEEDLHSCDSILKALYQDLDNMSEDNKMKFYLIYADVQNKKIAEMPSDSLFFEVVNYYDHNGSANEQLRAHYLLGCIYRDMKDAPVALQCYLDAIGKADTLAKDCDYLTLMSVWGQMALIFNDQRMAKEELHAWQKYSHYAEKIGNTYEAIRGIDLSTYAYSILGDTAKVISMTHELFNMYKEQGFKEEAYGVYPSLIDILLLQGKYTEAYPYMIDYETKSGLFVGDSITTPDREMYYNSKGMYYCGINKLDSAEIFYRRLLNYDRYKYVACRGLMKVYREKNMVDSIIKFTNLQEKAWEDVVAEQHTQAMHQVSSMYDYSRYQRIAEEKSSEAKFNALLFVFAIFVSVVVGVALYFLFIRYKAMKKKELDDLSDTYKKTKTDYEKTKTEYAHAVDNLEEQKEKFEKFQQEKLVEVETLKSKYDNLKSKDDEAMLQNSQLVSDLRNILSPTSTKKFMSNADQDELLSLVRQYMPHFYVALTNGDRLSLQELLVCILVRLNFSGKDTSVLLNTSSSSVANAKKRANEKLFGMSQANMLITNLQNLGNET